MRIGLIAPPGLPVPPTAYGGTESVVDQLALGLVRAGHDVVLAAASNSTCPVPRVAGCDAVTVGAPVCADTVTELRHVVRGYAAMADAHVDVVHDHTLAGPLYRPVRHLGPVVTTAHGPFDATLGPLYRAMRDVAVVAISHHQASTAHGVPIAAVIHHGLDVEAVRMGRGDGGYASFLGRMSPEKGPRQAALVAREAGVPLRMAAKLREPAEREYFEAEVRPLLGSDVEFLGELDGAEKMELIRDSCALLNPMQWDEPFGLVMIEALAAGTPVVATPVGSAPEIVDDGITGFLRRDQRALVTALVNAVELDRRACRASAIERFSTGRMVAQHVRLYEHLSNPRHTDDPLRVIRGTTSPRAAAAPRLGGRSQDHGARRSQPHATPAPDPAPAPARANARPLP